MYAIRCSPERREAVNEKIGRRWEWWPGMQTVADDGRKLRVETATYRGGTARVLEGWCTDDEGIAQWCQFYVTDGDANALDLEDKTTLAALAAQNVDLYLARMAARD